MVRQHHTDSRDINMSKLQGTVEDRGAWHATGHGVKTSWTRLGNNNANCRRNTEQQKEFNPRKEDLRHTQKQKRREAFYM